MTCTSAWIKIFRCSTAGSGEGHGRKQADAVSILFINPQNGEIYADVNVPEFDLNEPLP